MLGSFSEVTSNGSWSPMRLSRAASAPLLPNAASTQGTGSTRKWNMHRTCVPIGPRQSGNRSQGLAKNRLGRARMAPGTLGGRVMKAN